MKVSTTQPFQIVYSIFQHECLGYLLESFVIQVNSKGSLTFQHQNISSQNAREFAKGLDENDFELIKLIEQIQQENIVKKFYTKKVKPTEFFLKVYDAEKGDKPLQKLIELYIEERMAKIIARLKNDKLVFVMGKDGSPIWKKLKIADESVSVLFHFRRNEEGTNYFPTLKYKNKKLDFQHKGAFILAYEPAWMVLGDMIYHFTENIDGYKLKPFLNKFFIAIPRKLEETYYKKFIVPLIATCDVFADGFKIDTVQYNPHPQLVLSEKKGETKNLFGEDTPQEDICLELVFKYDNFSFKALDPKAKGYDKKGVKVQLQQQEDEYTFYRVKRNLIYERDVIRFLERLELTLRKGENTMPRGEAFQWISTHSNVLKEYNFQIIQQTQSSKRYFLGQAQISLEINENTDWFDIYAKIYFGEYEIPFLQLRKYILQKKTEFALPNGEIAVIPEAWVSQYAELFAFAEQDNGELPTLKKHHLNLIEELRHGEYAQVRFHTKLQRFKDFEKIDEYDLPEGFEGTLRSYQKSGYNWLNFLNEYGFGGCLADDMGLGKTVQTLALLQSQKQKAKAPSLLIIPTSLIYNWELEASKFTPELKIFNYTGTNRNKEIDYFSEYDLIITSYGIVRIDIDLLKNYPFHYIILDESQAIKNPSSNISQAVRELRSKHRLILTGTPLENTTLDLWSQMSFINPGLLGTQTFFKNEFLNPIERKKDIEKSQKLSQIIKPFILRRLKSQVALDLPEKIENIQYCLMNEAQEELYERTKSQYRNQILLEMEQKGTQRSQFLLLQGLTKLRQIANHPRLVEEDYKGDSGKMEDVRYKLENIISEGHKVLVFSQFVKHLDILREYLDEQKIPYAYLDGSTRDRQAQVETFQTDDKYKVFLISLKAGGVGLNLTAAEYVFLLDPWWNPAVEAQAVDRAHRIGQTSTVFTYKFISRNSVEEKILALQQSKRQLTENIISSEEGFVKSLSPDDMLSLLQ
jgi:SNF2 family DNA or RNA helicase